MSKKVAIIIVAIFVLLASYILLKRPVQESFPQQSNKSKTLDSTVVPQKSRKIAHFSLEEYPPFTSESLKGQGLLSIVVREALALEGIDINLTFYPGSRAYNMALEGKSDGTYNWADREDRHQHFHYSDWLMVAERDLFFYKKGFEFDWDSKKQDFSQLSDLKIVANLGYNYGPKFQKAEEEKLIKVYRVPTMKQAFSMILNERAHLYLHFDIVGRHFVKENLTPEQQSGIEYTLAIEDEKVEYDYVLFSKKAENGQFFQMAFNRGLAKLKASGRYDEIFESWFAK